MRLLRRLPLTLRVPLLAALMMILFGVVASQVVLSALNQLQDARVREVARLHVEALSVALGPLVLRKDVWGIFDTLTRASHQGEGRRVMFTAVADNAGRVLAATDPRRAPLDSRIDKLLIGSSLPADLSVSTARTVLELAAPLVYQGREVGTIVTELDARDFLSERRNAANALIGANILATAILAMLAYLLTARMLRPLQDLSRRMDDTTGEPVPFTPEVIPKGDTELSRLFLTYNRMADAITAKQAAESRIAERERFVSLGRLSTTLAHEINNPLGGLMNATDTIRKYADRPEVVENAADILWRGLRHLADVVKATLDFNRIDRNDADLTPEDIEDIKVLVEPELRRRGQKLDWQSDVAADDIAQLPAAPARQIVLNLLLNASAVAGEKGVIGLHFHHNGKHLVIEVSDTGPGMPDETKQRLLSSQPVQPGGGIGLRLVHDLVEENNGQVSVRRTNKQTFVVVRFPVAAKREQTDA